MNSSKEYLFVYGTLMRASGNPGHLMLKKNGHFAGRGWFQGKLFMVADYPGVVPSNNPDDQVTGELYSLKNPKTVFRKLDAYEGYNSDNPDNSLYTREKGEIIVDDPDKSVRSWIYVYNRPIQGLTPIHSGNFLKYLHKN